MTIKKKINICTALGLGLALLSTLVMVKLYADSFFYAAKNTVYISPVLNNTDYMFTDKEVRLINDNRESALISFEKISGATLSYESNNIYAKVIYTDSNYFDINHLDFIEGSKFPAEYNKDHIIILSDSLAYKLFGSYSCLGKGLHVNGALHEITGVVSQKSDDYGQFAWIPYESAGFSGSDISAVYIMDFNYQKLDTYKKASSYLDRADKLGSYYHLVDLNQYSANMLLRVIAVIYIILAGVIIYFLIEILKCMDDYYGNLKRILLFLTGIAVTITAIVLINADYGNLLWISKESFSLSLMLEKLMNLNALPGAEYLPYQLARLKSINSYSITAFAVCILGLINFVILCWAGGNNG